MKWLALHFAIVLASLAHVENEQQCHFRHEGWAVNSLDTCTWHVDAVYGAQLCDWRRVERFDVGTLRIYDGAGGLQFAWVPDQAWITADGRVHVAYVWCGNEAGMTGPNGWTSSEPWRVFALPPRTFGVPVRTVSRSELLGIAEQLAGGWR